MYVCLKSFSARSSSAPGVKCERIYYYGMHGAQEHEQQTNNQLGNTDKIIHCDVIQSITSINPLLHYSVHSTSLREEFAIHRQDLYPHESHQIQSDEAVCSPLAELQQSVCSAGDLRDCLHTSYQISISLWMDRETERPRERPRE